MCTSVSITCRAYGADLRFPNFAWSHLHSGHCVSSVHDAPRPVGKLLIVNATVVRCDEHKIKALNSRAIPFYRFLAGPMRMLTGRLNHRHVGIVILHLAASLTQKGHQNVTG